MPRDDDDGQAAAALEQGLLQGHAVHARHADVDQHAAGPVRPPGGEHVLGGGEQRDAVALDPQQQAQRIAHRGVVVCH